jgi:hypothetical protein
MTTATRTRRSSWLWQVMLVVFLSIVYLGIGEVLLA